MVDYTSEYEKSIGINSSFFSKKKGPVSGPFYSFMKGSNFLHNRLEIVLFK